MISVVLDSDHSRHDYYKIPNQQIHSPKQPTDCVLCVYVVYLARSSISKYPDTLYIRGCLSNLQFSRYLYM